MIEVELPDGTIAEFPDGTSRETMKQVLNRRFSASQEQQEDGSGALGDILPSLGSGLRTGVEALIGLPGDLNRWGGMGAEWVAEKLGASPETIDWVGSLVENATVFPNAPTSEETKAGLTDPILGDALTHDPQTKVGEYAQTLGEFLPSAIGGPGGIGRRVVTQALLPATGSEAAGQATEGTALEPYARVGGALAGGLAGGLAPRAVTPNPARHPGRIDAAGDLAREGIDVSAGQRTGNDALIRREGGSRGVEDLAQRQMEQFTAAALKRAGIDATRATPDVMNDAFNRLGRQFDDIARQTDVPVGSQTQAQVRNIADDYLDLSGNPAPVVRKFADRIAEVAQKNGGTVPGEAYQSLRSELGRRARSTQDNATKEALMELQAALDDAAEQVMPKELAAQWKQTRREYRNLLALEDAATRAGEAAAAGLITPQALRGATVRTHGRRSYARGTSDLAELARAGEEVMKKFPSSDNLTSRIRSLGNVVTSGGVGGGVGAVLGGALGPLAGLGAAAGVAVPGIGNAMRMAKPIQRYLSNQVMAGVPSTPGTSAAIPGLFEWFLQENREGG